jgi:hypothetical protein
MNLSKIHAVASWIETQPLTLAQRSRSSPASKSPHRRARRAYRASDDAACQASSRHWYRETAKTRVEVTYAAYRCALPCGDAGGFERAGLGRLGVYRRRNRIRGWKRVRDDDLAPFKATFCILGGIGSGLTAIVSPSTAGKVAMATCGGSWTVTPNMMRGRESPKFIGDTTPQRTSASR